MSSLTYEEYYRDAMEDLVSIWKEDVNLTRLLVPPSGRQRYEQLLQYWTSLYAQYLRAARRLAAAHDAQLQPQKRYDVRTLLDSCLGRMLEIRALLTANCGEFVKLDDVMLDLKISPDELEVPIPRYFVEDNALDLQGRHRQIASLQAHYRETEPNAPITKALVAAEAAASAQGGRGVSGSSDNAAGGEKRRISLDDAVTLLQINERGRQARQRAKFQIAMYAQQKHALTYGTECDHVTEKERAATVLQKTVQAYLTRKRMQAEHAEELGLLGMRPTAETTSNAERAAAEARLEGRKARQRLNEAEYMQKAIELETRIKAEEGPHTMEEMLNEVLVRMAYARLESKDDTPLTFPTPEEGGSCKYLETLNIASSGMLTADGVNTVSQGYAGSVTVRSSVGDGTAGGVGKRKGAASSMRRRGEEEEGLPAMEPSSLWECIKATEERYNAVWKSRFEQSYLKEGDLDQKADVTLLRQQLLEGPLGIMKQLRSVVDQLIMIEVENLKRRLEQERRGGKKKKKGGNKRGLKKPRPPKLKDPTKGVDIETFVNSAVHQNVLQLPDPSVRLEDYMGCAMVHESPLDALLRMQKPDDEMRKKWQRILNNWSPSVEEAMRMKKDAFQRLFDKYLQQASWLSEPSAAQVRQSVTEYVILPLGSQVIHDLAPSAKTLLLYGFPGSGKTLLVHSVCNHSGANLFDLSPANFETNTGLVNIVQMVFHLAKVMAPSVVHIDKIEKLFPRKKKTKGPRDPLLARGKKMRKEVLRGIAGLAPTDRVMVIGATSAPWESDLNALVKNFVHMVHCANPDYASRITILQKLIAVRAGDAGALGPEHYHELALLTEGFTSGNLNTIVQSTLHRRRLRRLMLRPLKSCEFLRAVAQVKPPSAEDQTQMRDFSLRLPLYLRRINPPVDIPLPEKKDSGGRVQKKKKKEEGEAG